MQTRKVAETVTDIRKIILLQPYLAGPGMTLLYRLKFNLSDLKVKEEPDLLMMAVAPVAYRVPRHCCE